MFEQVNLMQLRLLRHEDTIFEFEIEGVSHTYLNLLRQYLKEHEHVQFAAYRVTIHTEPVFHVRTAKGIDPMKAIAESNERIIKTCKSLDASIKKQKAKFTT